MNRQGTGASGTSAWCAANILSRNIRIIESVRDFVGGNWKTRNLRVNRPRVEESGRVHDLGTFQGKK